MKKTIMTIIAIGISTITFAQEKIKINTDKSVVNWFGSNLMGFNNHHGTVLFKEGAFVKTDNKITGGSFTIAMTTIANVDGGYNEGLVKHLKDPDFFDVEKFPTAHLAITNIKYVSSTSVSITANLTIKGITHAVDFEAELDYDRKEMIANLIIDRTKWDIIYGSYQVVNIKDHIIDHQIKFKVEIRI